MQDRTQLGPNERMVSLKAIPGAKAMTYHSIQGTFYFCDLLGNPIPGSEYPTMWRVEKDRSRRCYDKIPPFVANVSVGIWGWRVRWADGESDPTPLQSNRQIFQLQQGLGLAL